MNSPVKYRVLSFKVLLVIFGIAIAITAGGTILYHTVWAQTSAAQSYDKETSPADRLGIDLGNLDTTAFGAVIYLTAPSTKNGIINGGVPRQVQCVSDAERDAILFEMEQLAFTVLPPQAATVFFADPVDGGMNSAGKTVTNYVDLDPSGGLLDYNCGTVTYNGHDAIDVEIADFYDMDEGVPVLAAAAGIVTYTHDGEFDRNLGSCGGGANIVFVQHADGSMTYYYHMRKNSIQVSLYDSVEVGDTLGYIGSSGCSSWPHLHFAIRDPGITEAFNGPCQTDPTRWISQPAYIFDVPFELIQHGATDLPLGADWTLVSERPPSVTHVTAPSTLWSWIRTKSINAGDELAWALYVNGAKYDSTSFVAADDYRNAWWYYGWGLPSSPAFHGNWTIYLYRNAGLMGQQNFSYDAVPNQLPVALDHSEPITNTEIFEDEFPATDADGSIFWYEVVSLPNHGEFAQFGGRKRKLSYLADDGFVGEDTVTFKVFDDHNAEGSTGEYVFVISQGCVDPDGDGYGTPGYVGSPCPDDNCPIDYNPGQEDIDGDGYGDVCDNCPDDYNPGQEDTDFDGVGDICDIIRVWHVNAGGTGDAPTIQAGIDSCLNSDTVYVAAGTYTGAGNRDLDFNGRRIAIVSENGPGQAIIDCQGAPGDPWRAFTFQNNEGPSSVIDGLTIRGGYGPTYSGSPSGGGIFCDNASPMIKNCIFTDNAAFAGAAVYAIQASLQFVNCTFVDNAASNGAAMFLYDQSVVTLDNCLIAFNPSGGPISCYLSSTATAICTDIYGNGGGDWTGCLAGQDGVNDNFSSDPYFCDMVSGDYQLGDESACAEANSPCAALVGALGVGCIYCTVDSDGDGFGDPGHPENMCADDNCPDDYNPDQVDADDDTYGAACDCNDENPDMFPGADEYCNGEDDDCNGIPDDNAVDMPTWYEDADGDGFGNPAVSVTQCDSPPGYVLDGTDNCPEDYNQDQEDGDEDAVGDVCDNCEFVFNPEQADSNDDGQGDACDCDCLLKGDVNNDESTDPLDVTYLVSYVYLSQDALAERPDCPYPKGDVNCDESADPLDVTYLVNYVYLSQDALCDGCAPPAAASYIGPIMIKE